MKALVYTGPKAMELRKVAEPTPADGEVLIRIEACGICGSDMHAWAGHDERRPAPLTLGHEAVGVVAGGDEGWTGKRVAINPLVTCGNCPDCSHGRTNICQSRQIISMPPREGGFAQAIAMPVKNLVEISADLPVERAALAEPVACGWHAVGIGERALFGALSEARCVVIGGGAIGLGVAAVLASRDAREIHIAETNPLRRPGIEKAGPYRVFDPASGDVPTDPDLVIDAYGGEATRAFASKIVRQGGVIVHIGLGQPGGGLDTRRMTLQEVTFIGTYTYTADEFRQTVAAIADGTLGPLDWTEMRPLAVGAQAFTDLAAGTVPAAKIILLPG